MAGKRSRIIIFLRVGFHLSRECTAVFKALVNSYYILVIRDTSRLISSVCFKFKRARRDSSEHGDGWFESVFE